MYSIKQPRRVTQLSKERVDVKPVGRANTPVAFLILEDLQSVKETFDNLRTRRILWRNVGRKVHVFSLVRGVDKRDEWITILIGSYSWCKLYKTLLGNKFLNSHEFEFDVVRVKVFKVHPYLPQTAERVGVIWGMVNPLTNTIKF
jgi:hypothetical protein